ncbi:MAG: protein kinase [Candidatus Krumholzibacteria bacterium]|nr:protein kinase [Candidatus Krumholzibacteria bacterium]MDH4338657.1 protein kinase [Candidatus Krumholzibacteria bacterium]MDH5198399.1 protein kinase [Gemmatimonadota bacterium]
MNPERYRRASELLAEAFEFPAGDRLAYLRMKCGEDLELFTEASSLLEHALESASEIGASPLKHIRSTADEESLCGRNVGRFNVIDELGRGGMGIVWRAHDPVLDRPVAIKFLPAPLARSQMARERFLSEARAASSLDHAHVATIYDFGEAEGKSFIALRLVEGQTVAQHRAAGPMPAATALRVAIDVARALEHAHERRVLHRDVSASNVMITPAGRGILLDFGLAASAGAARSAGRRGGTPYYIAPEVRKGAAPDERSDIFALGVVLYEMLTGRYPFPPTETTETGGPSLSSQDPPPPRPPGVLNPGLPARADSAVLSALDSDPHKRPRTAGEFAAELEVALLDLTRPGHSRRPRRIAMYAAIGVATVSAAAYIATRDRAIVPVAAPVLAAWTVPGADSARAATLETLLQTGLAENSPCRVLSAQHVSGIRKRAAAKGRHDAIDLAREAGATLVLTSEITASGDERIVSWSLSETASRRSLKHGRMAAPDLMAAVDSVIAQTLPDIAAHSGTRAPIARRLPAMTTSSADAYELYMQGQKLYLENRYTDAVTVLDRALDIDTTFALAGYQQSQAFNELGRQPAAHASADLAWRHRERLSLRDRLRVEAWRDRLALNGADAMKTYAEMLDRWPDDHDALKEMSIAKWWYWHWSEALEYAVTGLALYPDDLFFLEMTAGGLTATGRADEAIPVSRRRIAIDDSFDAWDMLADNYMVLGKPDSALAALEQGMRVDPRPLELENRLITIAYVRGDLEQAIELAEAYAGNSGLTPRERYRMRVNTESGVVSYYLRAGRYRDALALLTEANQSATEVDAVRRDVNMCNLLSRIGRHGEALDYIVRCRTTEGWTRDPNVSKYNRPDGEIRSLIAVGRLGEARQILTEDEARGRETMMLFANHYFSAARLALAEGDAGLAIEQLELAVRYGKIWAFTDIDYRLMRAEAFQMEQRLDEAEAEVRDVIEHHPGHRIARYHLARILDERGATDAAAAEYRSFLEGWWRADPDLPEVIAANERLLALGR